MPTTAFAKHSVLVADPSEHMGNIVASMLRTIGVKDVTLAMTTAATGAELKRRKYDTLIIDSDLRTGDPLALVRAVRADDASVNRLIPVIMMSSLPDAERIVAARDAGVTEFLRKPFAANHLLTRLNSIAANPRPFIATEAYVGPDRRRHTGQFAGDDRRGKA